MGLLQVRISSVDNPRTKKCLAGIADHFFPLNTTFLLIACLLAFGQNGISQCDNVINGGMIAADEFGCPDPDWDPSLIVSLSLPTGGSGALEYVWMMTTDDPSIPMSQWAPVPNSNSPEYDPGPITVTTYYRRCARRAGCIEYVGESNIVMKEAICCDNVTNGGKIGMNQTFCEPPFDPLPLENQISPTGGTLALEYQWVVSTTGTPYDPLNPDWSEIPGANEMDFDPGTLTETTYFIRLSRRHGCYDYDGVSNMITIIIGDEIVIDLSLTEATCLGVEDASVLVSNITGGALPYTYAWNDPLNSTTEEINDLGPGIYEVTVTDDYGCTGTASIEVQDGPPLQVETTVEATTCPGDLDGEASVISVNGLAPYTYLWNDANMQTTETAINLPPATYEVVVTDDRGCIGTGTAVVPDADPLVLSTISTPATCSDAMDGTATVQVTGGVTPYTYLWNDANSQTTATAFNLTSGAYEVTVTDANGCTETATQMVTAPMPIELVLTGEDVTCFGLSNGTAEVAIVGGDPVFYNFLWDDPSASTTNIVTDLGPGIYSVTVTDTAGCTVEGSVSISEPTELILTAESDSASCWNSSDGTASVFASGGTPFPGGNYQYVWNAPGNPSVQVLDDVSPGTYTATVTDANGCTESIEVEIGAPEELIVELTIEHVSCNGFDDGSISASVSGGVGSYTYQWSAPGNPTTDNISNLPPGNYSLTVTDGNGCMVVSSAGVNEPDALTLDFQIEHVICEDDENGSAAALVTGGMQPYSFEWSNGATTIGLSNIGIGVYSLTVTDANGCEITGSTEIDFTSTLSSSATGMDATCFDEADGSASATGIDGTPPYTYLWSNGETAADITGLIFNTYTVTVTDADGCTSESIAVVNAPPLLECSIDILSEVLTFGGDEGAASVSATGGVQPYEFEWSDGSTIETVTGLSAGTHSVTVTDANGCDCIRNITLENPSKIGNFIWNDENQNGIQDINEVGVEGIVLNLTGQTNTGDPVSMTTTSDGLGEYAFDGLQGGFYEVEIELPPNHVLTYDNVGNDNLDSDFDQMNLMTQTFVLGQGVYDSRWDGGLIILDEFINIGDFVWYDVNKNGIQDFNEAGVEGVNVKLINTANQIIATTTTNQIGYYLFEDVSPGDYVVEFSLASFPSGGYILSPKDQGTDDNIDSDPYVSTGKTDVFTVFPFTLDNLTIDAGIFKECDNITDGGLIGYDEDLCGVGADPDEIVNVEYPSGGYGTIEYLWLQSTVPIYNGQGDPNWSIIPNSNSESYDPGPISVSTYFIRCARREGCTDYIGESNIVAKTITAYPLTQITQQPNTLCMTEAGQFTAAIAGAGATYHWEFGADATPPNAYTRVVDPVSWATPGLKSISLTVTRFGCSFTIETSVFIENCTPNPLIIFEDINADLLNGAVELNWVVEGELENVFFTIQCSENGVDYQSVGMVPGSNELAGGKFRFIDESPRLGENTYRIRYQYLTGPDQTGYSPTATVYHQPNEIGIVAVYPNPTSSQVTVELLQVSDEPATLKVLTPLGKVVETIVLAPHTEKVGVNLQQYNFGLYLFEVKQAGKQPQVCRVFKLER